MVVLVFRMKNAPDIQKQQPMKMVDAKLSYKFSTANHDLVHQIVMDKHQLTMYDLDSRGCTNCYHIGECYVEEVTQRC